jgi:hypothetical protein
MREIRQSGSEGGATTVVPTPIVSAFGHQGHRNILRFRIDIYKDFAPTEHDPVKIQMRDTHAKVEALPTGAWTMSSQPESWKVRRIRRTREQKSWGSGLGGV